MSDFQPPLRAMRLLMDELGELPAIAGLPGFEEATPELADAVLEEAARFAGDILAPLNAVGDRVGCRWRPEGVATPPGWDEAYRHFCAGGWNGISADPAYGGQGLPCVLSVAVRELFASANLAFSIGPLLTAGAIEALRHCASDSLRQRYLPKMIDGSWSGTMNLTEPQAGSDLAQLRTRAEPQADGRFRIFGQKIFISYGEHELTENIIHLVLARLPDAPPGVRGISLFVVPKFLPDANGQPGERNDVVCSAIEHKLGIHGSPTCVMVYGENGGAIGELVGEANRGLEYMFVMMNEARHGVGVQGVALGERALQLATAYAAERRQGRDAVSGEALVSIDHHPDVQRMLRGMQMRVEATRALAYYTAGLLDRAHAEPEEAARQAALYMAELLMPLVKAGGTEMAVEVTSTGIQVHGGMGFIEETGAARLWRDARITPIYEGTTGIQANDLIFRKLLRDKGATAERLFADIAATRAELAADAGLAALGEQLQAALAHWQAATAWVLARIKTAPGPVLFAAVPYLELSGLVTGGWLLGRLALASRRLQAAGCTDTDLCTTRRTLARLYGDTCLSRTGGLAATVMAGDSALTAD